MPEGIDLSRSETFDERELRQGEDFPALTPLLEDGGHLKRSEQPAGEQARAAAAIEVQGLASQVFIPLKLLGGKLFHRGGATQKQHGIPEGIRPINGTQITIRRDRHENIQQGRKKNERQVHSKSAFLLQT